MTRRLALISILALAAAACARAPGALPLPLRGAAETPDYQASVLVRVPPSGLCSGSLVHPRIAVTAWHCATSDGMSVEATVGGVTSSYTVVARFVPDPSAVVTVDDFARDMAVLVVDREIEGITPYALAFDGVADRRDAPVRAVAYGNGSGLTGRRQTSTGMIVCDARREDDDSLYPMYTTVQAAPGDSGGTVLDERGALVGVLVGIGTFGGCVRRDGSLWRSSVNDAIAARIEPNAALLVRAFESIGASPPEVPPEMRMRDSGSRDLDAGTTTDSGADVPDASGFAPSDASEELDASTFASPDASARPGDSAIIDDRDAAERARDGALGRRGDAGGASLGCEDSRCSSSGCAVASARAAPGTWWWFASVLAVAWAVFRRGLSRIVLGG